MLKITPEQKANLGYDLDAAIVEFRAEVEAHRKTIGVPAPTADPLVAAIVLGNNDQYEVVEEETGLPPDEPLATTSRLDMLYEMINELLITLKKAQLIPPETCDKFYTKIVDGDDAEVKG